jgi:hypothetical protein
MLVFVAVAMVVLLGFLAMTLDVGAGNRQRRIAQTAADAGALGGGTEIFRLQYDSVVSSARNEAVRNGFSADDVTVNYPPISAPYTGNPQYVEVTIDKTIPTIFGSLFSFASLNIAARAIAGVGSYSLTCLYSLDPDAPKAIEISISGSGGGSGQVVTNCGVAVNSNDGNALELNTSGNLDTGGSPIAVTGGWDGNPTKVSPVPTTSVAPVSNPLSYLPIPAAGSCISTGLLTITKDTTLSPGTYCGGIYVDNKTATLLPGTYITAGGGFKVRGGRVVGDQVTLVNTIDSTGTYVFRPIEFGNGCQASLSAPRSGDLKGVLMIGDPAGPTGAINTYACASDVPPELTGTLYFPTQEFFFNGSNSGTTLLGSIIANNVLVSGKLTIQNDTSPNNALKRLSLVK